MTILLDIDGVLVTTPPWRKPELLGDNFMKFDEKAAGNLAILLQQTNAGIVLTTTHRVSHSEKEWLAIFRRRGINLHFISRINNASTVAELKSRKSEIEHWVNTEGQGVNYIIIDDDPSLADLPQHIRARWVRTQSHEGISETTVTTAISILRKT